MHLNAVGGDCPGKTELHADVLRRPDLRVVVEFEPQSRIEGEIQQMPPDYPVIEFARVVRGEATVRRSASDVTLFDSVGFALEDYSALRFLYALVREQQLGRRSLDLVPVLADPKDLFGGTLAGGRAHSRSSARRTA
jgi:ornithine cyclodeaminase